MGASCGGVPPAPAPCQCVGGGGSQSTIPMETPVCGKQSKHDRDEFTDSRNKSDTDVHESPSVDGESAPLVPPLHPSQLIPHPHFPGSPPLSAANSCTLPKTPTPAQEATQEPAGLPSKAASLVAPRNANRFGNRQNTVGMGGGGRGGINTSGSSSNQSETKSAPYWQDFVDPRFFTLRCSTLHFFFFPFDKRTQSIHGVNTATFPLKPLELSTNTGEWSGQSYDFMTRLKVSPRCLSGRAAGGQPFFILDTADNFFLVQSLIDRVCV
ncbi:unnamed protein product [Pleuronectes platessa]|uniref:Uncharacterized protein n=1 Tax=Pleuronectes platessa TaxID=8262 RepID=A0A9N7UN85_PLEPL|nr:unnamed protein product [Pleuronectes platessa]